MATPSIAPAMTDGTLMGLRRRLASKRHPLASTPTSADPTLTTIGGHRFNQSGDGVPQQSSIVRRIRERNDPNLYNQMAVAAENRRTAQAQHPNREAFPPRGESPVPVMQNLLTQAGMQPQAQPQPQPPSGARASLSDSSPRDRAAGAGGRQGPHSIDHGKLKETRRSPKNLSPASGFHLDALLPPQEANVAGRVTLVLDIDETLVHASFTPAKPFDTRLTIETETERGYIYVAYRPKLYEFLKFVAKRFEIVVFTASMSCYAIQLMDQLDPEGKLGKLRLFREHCTEMRNVRVKDMSLLGRPLDRVAIIDNSHVAYLFQPRNAIPIISWFDDKNDTEFERLMPMLDDLANCADVYSVLDEWNCIIR